MTKGFESLKAAVLKDTGEGENCFNPNGCDKTNHRCFHRYCDTYKWAVDRAEHYAEIIGTTPEAILSKWEEDRTYWYMNYYQDCNQPLIEGNSVKIFDTLQDYKDSVQNKAFRCPRCEGVSTDPYECTCEGCDWKSYGLFKTLDKGVTVVIKESLTKGHIFMPIAWEK